MWRPDVIAVWHTQGSKAIKQCSYLFMLVPIVGIIGSRGLAAAATTAAAAAS